MTKLNEMTGPHLPLIPYSTYDASKCGRQVWFVEVSPNVPPLSSWSGRARKSPPVRSELPPSHIDHLLRLFAFLYLPLSHPTFVSISFFFTFKLRLRYHLHRSIACRQRSAVLTKQHRTSHHSLTASSSITLVCPPLRSQKSDSHLP